MLLPLFVLCLSLVFLVLSADRFVAGSSALARLFGMPPLLIGMVIVGFGTSAPEMIVSAQASLAGQSGIALGNAYGSNFLNIALILGVTALISPILVQSQIVRKEIPLLLVITALAAYQAWDGIVTRLDALVLLAFFGVLIFWSVKEALKAKNDALKTEFESELSEAKMSNSRAWLFTIFGLVVLIISSRFLVWGAVELAHILGMSDLVIGLTIVAAGTSLPELASSIAAARKGEHDIALGNIVGSNLFNSLAVVGLAGLLKPLQVPTALLVRDIPLMGLITLVLLIMCFGFKGPGKINRLEGAILLLSFIVYTSYLVFTGGQG